MASRKEQKEALRREREEREREAKEAERRKRLIGYGAAGVLVTAAIVTLAVVFLGGGGDDEAAANLLPDGGDVPVARFQNADAAVKAGRCETKSTRPTSADHTQDPDEPIKYATNPPAAGQQYEVPAEDKAYDRAPKDSEVAHALEHSRVVIWYSPALPQADRKALKAYYDQEQGFQLLLVPRRKMPYKLAATAWNREPGQFGTGRLLGCPSGRGAALDAVRLFVDEHRGNGPEAG